MAPKLAIFFFLTFTLIHRVLLGKSKQVGENVGSQKEEAHQQPLMRQHCTTSKRQLRERQMIGRRSSQLGSTVCLFELQSARHSKAIGSLDLGRNCVTHNKPQLLLRGPGIQAIATKFAHVRDKEQINSGHFSYFHLRK
ncbi:hypothetical protein MCOR27_000133 [Pyricularia oryzae]|uniref:Secreted protein n=5 Tax=Pyricularia TaxID=48558 RepID=A0ABQ8NPP8_PYRGI|nr:uncharacterized protein MGG_16123 [Pyricularia oryzae 70-15]ELQ43439.1 hypothetical protein OOU_Y34scaffold00151g7 [Pyricularia oryzae Y34]KAH8842643.1 hypothetical protein MCOR01_006539 [Pyricularia oryzae]KAI6298974.1 hypothetical protein MCOR33_005029 [Pyricularia grisea]EHA56589.1 hypothetical protein MGG_16123 [Pyricularia oryzae 70-15]KAH9435892.1 hypothetical protein MCOR02_004804 [Pyricularia oryzae]